MSSTPGMRREDRDGVVTVTFTRDEKLNAVSHAMIDELDAIAHEVESDDSLRVLVITAEGRYFTAGADVSGGVVTDDESGPTIRRKRRRIHELFDQLEVMEKPVVHAAQGPCLGFGLEMAASCDFRLASERATYSLPELSSLAVLPGSGGMTRLTRIIGPHWTRWMVMASRSIDAERAFAIGLVHEVYPEAEFSQRVAEFAHSLTPLSAEGLGLAKLTIDAAVNGDRRTARDIDRIANTLLFKNTEHADKIAEFQARSAARKKKADG